MSDYVFKKSPLCTTKIVISNAKQLNTVVFLKYSNPNVDAIFVLSSVLLVISIPFMCFQLNACQYSLDE